MKIATLFTLFSERETIAEAENGHLQAVSSIFKVTVRSKNVHECEPEIFREHYRSGSTWRSGNGAGRSSPKLKAEQAPERIPLRAIRTGLNEEPTFHRGTEVQEVLDACFLSEEKQQTVPILPAAEKAFQQP